MRKTIESEGMFDLLNVTIFCLDVYRKPHLPVSPSTEFFDQCQFVIRSLNSIHSRFMHSQALYIGAYAHMTDGYSCYSDPFRLTFYLLPLCLHSLLPASGWRGAVAKHLKLMRLLSTTHRPVCGWGSAGHSHLCLSFRFPHPFCRCTQMEDWAGVHDCLGSLWHLLHRRAVYLGINMHNPSLQCQDARATGGAHVLSPGSYAHESWAQPDIANSVRPP